MPRAPRTIAIAFVAALAVIAACRRYLPDLLSPFQFEDDARQHVWWTYRFADRALFPDDLAADYFSRFTFAPPGYQLLARTFVPFVDAQVFSEIVPFAIVGIVAVLAWLLGRAVSGGSLPGAVVASTFALLGGVVSRVEGGLPRSWAMPVLLFGLWALLRKRWILFGASLVVTVLFYPPLVVNLALLGAAVLALVLARERRMPRGWLAGGALAVAAVAILFFEYRTAKPDPFGPKVTEKQARAMPEFWQHGRSHFFSSDPVEYYVTNERSGLGLEPWKLGLVCAALAIGAWLFPRAVPPAVWLIPVTSLLAYAVAHATLFKLHLPSRYTRFTLPAFLMLWLAAVVPFARDRLRASAPRPAVLAALALIAVLAFAAESALRIRHDLSRVPPQGYADLMGFLRGLPVDAKIAAHPRDASDFPLLARRSVIACEETSTPYDLGYYGTMKERISAELEACYASDWSTVDRLRRDHGASVFVVDRRRYDRPSFDAPRLPSGKFEKPTYFEPFLSAVADAIAKGAKDGFVLAKPPEDRILFSSERYLVVRLKDG